MRIINVNASKSYDVIIGSGTLESAGERLGELSHGRLASVVTDRNVDALYGERIEKSFVASGFKTFKFIIEPGEASKTTEEYVRLLNFLADSGMTRSDAVVALGGGVVGDLAGFAAATYMRGVGFMQIPTTLLAAVDSSVGGKTAVDLDAGKNLAGAFYQPDIVLCDTDTFKTLPQNVLADGYAEVIKYGVIADLGLLSRLDGGDSDMELTVARCVAVKRDIVERDERETGERKLLNFGHTVGHAIELCSGYGVSHGSAVAAGMAVITRAAEGAGLCGEDCYPVIARLLDKFRLPRTCGYSASELARAALSDKKREGDTITLVVPKSLGRCVLHDVAVADLETFIAGGLD